MNRLSGFLNQFLVVIACALPGSSLAEGRAINAKNAPGILYALPEERVVTELDEDGNVRRPEFSLAEKVFGALDKKWSYQAVPISRLYRYLLNGRANFAILIDSPAVRECCLLSKRAVYRLQLGVYRKRNTPEITKVEDLKGKSFITIQGYSFGPLKAVLADPENQIKLHPAKNHSSAFAMLAHGRAEYLLDYQGIVNNVVKEQEKYDLEYTVINTLDLYFILDKDYPNAEKVMDELEQAFVETHPELVRILDEGDW